MIKFRPKPKMNDWQWRFIIYRRIGDFIIFMEWMRWRGLSTNSFTPTCIEEWRNKQGVLIGREEVTYSELGMTRVLVP